MPRSLQRRHRWTRHLLAAGRLLAFFPIVLTASAAAIAAEDGDDGPMLRIRQRAETFEQLVGRTRPSSTFGDHDLLWVEHDADGRPFITMNRAYSLRLDANKAPQVCLLEARPGFTSGTLAPGDPPDAVNVDYTRSICTRPAVVARDPQRGVVYRCDWPSPEYSGAGHWHDVRTLILLCDGRHRWHLVGEGPQESEGRSGPADCFTTRVAVARVRWTGDPASPVVADFTSTTQEWTPLDGDKVEDPRWPTLEVRRDSTFSGAYPARRHDVGTPYTVVSRGESFDKLARRVARWHAAYDADDKDEARKQRTLAAVRQWLATQNPGLAEEIPAGTRVTLGDLTALAEAARRAAGPARPTPP